MTSETASSAVGPVPARQRLASLDMLRGLAVLGLLPMLVFSFATVSTGVLNPPTAGELAGADGTAWILYMLFVSHSFDALLAVTFGASVVLMTRL